MDTQSATPTEKTRALLGGQMTHVSFETASEIKELKVRQLRLVDYEKAYLVIDDEFAFVAFCCGVEKKVIMDLTPDSYERVQGMTEEVNKDGFFSYSRRCREREQKRQESMLAAAAHLPPESLRLASELGQSTSLTSLPRPRKI